MSGKYFSEWLSERPASKSERLPLAHVCSFTSMRDIVDSGELRTKYCETLKGNYAFAFYGRSAYRIRVDGTITSASLAPVCLLFNGKSEPSPAKRHPFDSGAFGQGKYAQTLQTKSTIGAYEISGDNDLQDRLIETFFKSREKYIDGDPSGILPIEDICDEKDSEVIEYHELITAKGTNQPDDRMHTVEFCFDEYVELEGNIIAAIVPDLLFAQRNTNPFFNKMEDWGAEIAPYRFTPGRQPEYYQSLIEGSLRDLFIKWGFYVNS